MGSRLYVYGIDASGAPASVAGAFTGSGPLRTGEFWAPPVMGSDLILELQVEGDIPADLPFRLTEIERLDASAAELLAAAESTASDSETVETSGLRYEIQDGLAIAGGDIILGPAEEVAARLQKAGKDNQRYSIGIVGSKYRYPGGVIPYVVDPLIPSPGRVTNAISHWNTNLNGLIKFVPRTNQYNYVFFRYASSASTCASSVGMQGYGGQSLYVGNYCSTGKLIHESGHAVGLWHNRLDRDSRVTVQWGNIQTGQGYNFYINSSNGFDIGAYDYNSIMHYPAYAFSSNGQPTIVTIPPGIPIGQRSGLSAGASRVFRRCTGKPPRQPPAPPR